MFQYQNTFLLVQENVARDFIIHLQGSVQCIICIGGRKGEYCDGIIFISIVVVSSTFVSILEREGNGRGKGEGRRERERERERETD